MFHDTGMLVYWSGLRRVWGTGLEREQETICFTICLVISPDLDGKETGMGTTIYVPKSHKLEPLEADDVPHRLDQDVARAMHWGFASPWAPCLLVCYLLLSLSLSLTFAALHETYEALIKNLPGNEIRRLAGLIGLEDASVGFLGSLRETLIWSMSDTTKQPVLLAEFEEALHGGGQWKYHPQPLPPTSATTCSSAIDLGTMTASSKICFPRQQSALKETLSGTLDFPREVHQMALHHLAAKPGVRRIFDIGPAWTRGSTQALADGLGSSGDLGCTSNITHHCCDKFVAAFEMQGLVWGNYRDGPVWFVPGTTVGEELLVKSKPFDTSRVHKQESSSSNLDDLENQRPKALARSKKPVLQDLCKVARPEVVLIGGSDYTVWEEFLVVVQWCRPRWIALQDVGTRRTAKIEDYIMNQPEKFVLVQEELGLAVYEISDSNIWAPGESQSGFQEFQRSILMQRPRWLSLHDVGTPEMAQIEGFVRGNPEIFALVEHNTLQDRSVFEVFGTLLWGVESTQGGQALRAQSLEMIYNLLLSPLPYSIASRRLAFERFSSPTSMPCLVSARPRDVPIRPAPTIFMRSWLTALDRS